VAELLNKDYPASAFVCENLISLSYVRQAFILQFYIITKTTFFTKITEKGYANNAFYWKTLVIISYEQFKF
jgi:hypothetical protein